MIKFHLQFPVQSSEHKISYKHKIMFIGSCFSENIGNLFVQNKLNSLINTHGIQYNPWSISNALNKCLLNQSINESELFFANEMWNSWEHHSRFSNSQKEDCLQQINNQLKIGNEFLKSADWIVITLGSSFVYKHIENNAFVANCHKVPQKQFSKHLFTTNEILVMLEKTINQIVEKNKNLKIVFTVSPVRYVRDGVVENNLSKARLIDAVHTLVNKFHNCFYFPSYELVIDDLRDYRFFERDLVHPNQQATEYVFDKFVDAYFDKESKIIIEKMKEINSAKNHRPVNLDSDSYQSFKNTVLEKCSSLKEEYAFLDLEKEIAFFS